MAKLIALLKVRTASRLEYRADLLVGFVADLAMSETEAVWMPPSERIFSSYLPKGAHAQVAAWCRAQPSPARCLAQCREER